MLWEFSLNIKTELIFFEQAVGLRANGFNQGIGLINPMWNSVHGTSPDASFVDNTNHAFPGKRQNHAFEIICSVQGLIKIKIYFVQNAEWILFGTSSGFQSRHWFVQSYVEFATWWCSFC